MSRTLISILLFSLSLEAQTKINGSRTITGKFDSSGATQTLPVKTGTAANAPSSCAANQELYIKTDSPAGRQLFICNGAGNGWNVVGDGGLSDPATNGIIIETGAGTTAARAITAGSANISVTNGNGVNGNPTVDVGSNVELKDGSAAVSGDRIYTGKVDASGASSTLPIQVGTAAGLPATCTTGAMYYASDAVPARKILSCTAANTWTPIAYDQGTVLPATCTTGQMYYKSDATAGRNLYFCTATNTWTQMTGGGGSSGAINAGAPLLFWPFGVTHSDSSAVLTPAGAANRGYRILFTVPNTIESRYVNFGIATASGTCGGTCGLVICIRNTALTQVLACTTVATSGGSPNLNVTGAYRLPWAPSSGSLVNSSGVATLPAGTYYLMAETDSTVLKWNAEATNSVFISNAGSQLMVAYASTSTGGGPTSTGNGASIAPIADVSGILFAPLTSSYIPLIAFTN